MEYTVGSVADLISGKSTSENVKVIKKEIQKTNIDSNLGHGSDKIRKIKKNKKKLNKKKLKKQMEQNADDMVVITPKDLEPVDEDKQQSDEEESKPEANESDPAARAEKDNRSVFVGNVPVNTSRGRLHRLFRPFGAIQSVRIRGLAPENPMINRRTVAIKNLVHPKRNSVIAYVVFRKREDALKALALNGTQFNDHYLRVTEVQDESHLPAKAIFIGQLDFEAEDNDLWQAFEDCGEIQSVRVVRDKFGVGTGIGYVNFKSADAVELALQMEDVQIKKRVCRVTRCNNPKDKRTKANNTFVGNKRKEIQTTKKFKTASKAETNVKKTVYRGKVAKKSDKKKFNKDMAQKMKLAAKIAPK